MKCPAVLLTCVLVGTGCSRDQTEGLAAPEDVTRSLAGTIAKPAEQRLSEYRKLLEEDVAPLKVLEDGMTRGEVEKLFPIAEPGMDAGAPILTFSSANGRKVVIYFHKATDRMSLVNVHLWARDSQSGVPEQTFEKLKAGITARWSRDDVVRLMGLPDHMSAVLNDFWQYGMYRIRFHDDVLQSVSPPPIPTPLPDRREGNAQPAASRGAEEPRP